MCVFGVSERRGDAGLTLHFESQLRQLLVPFLYDSVQKEGRRKAEVQLKDRVRAAIDTSRLLRLLPRDEKWVRREVEVDCLGKQRKPSAEEGAWSRPEERDVEV